MTETAEAIIERRQREDEVLREHHRAAWKRSRDAERAYAASLPQASPEPPIQQPRPDQPVVWSDRRIEAYDPIDRRVYVAAVPGQWYPAEFADQIGLDGPRQVLSIRPAT